MKRKLLSLLALLAVLLTGCGRQTQTKVIPISSLSPSATLQSSQGKLCARIQGKDHRAAEKRTEAAIWIYFI